MKFQVLQNSHHCANGQFKKPPPRWQKGERIVLHALPLHFEFFDISQTFSLFTRREITRFAAAWMTLAFVDKCSILFSYLGIAGSSLILSSGYLKRILQA